MIYLTCQIKHVDAKQIQAIPLTSVIVKCRVHAFAAQIALVTVKSVKKPYLNYKKTTFFFSFFILLPLQSPMFS